MASLKFRDKSTLEEYLEMGGGYVLNFSDRTFADFFRDFDIDIDSPEYLQGHSGSKANRMRTFWDAAPTQVVGDVIEELVELAESYRPGHPRADACRTIARRLQAAGSPKAPPWRERPPPVDPAGAPVRLKKNQRTMPSGPLEILDVARVS